MRISKTIFFSLLALCAISCQKDRSDGNGAVSFEICSKEEVLDDTKGLVSDYTNLPSPDDFSIVITDESSNNIYSGKVSGWEEDTPLPAGNYHVSASYGKEGEEGFDKPYFNGTADFTVAGGQTTEVSIPVELANSIIRIQAGDMFKKYYSDYSFSITTGNGTTIDFGKDETKGAFVDAWKFTVNGALTNQGGNKSTFEKAYSSINPKTCYTLKFDAEGIGGMSVTITFDNTTETVTLDEIDLNN